jgi:hypothetical protein
MKYSIVIPVVPKHDKFLKNVFECLSAENFLIKEIIVARSSLAPHQINRYKKFLMKISSTFDLEDKIVLSNEAKSCLAYANLNRGWLLAKGKFVTFLGADDIYAPYRLRVIDEVLRLRPESNAILHSYFYQSQPQIDLDLSNSSFEPYFELSSFQKLIESRLVDTDDIFNATFPNGKRDHLSESFGNTSLKMPKDGLAHGGVSQGNVVLRTEIREKVLYRPLQYCEDGVLCLDILENFGEVYFIGIELSIYRKFLSVNRIPSRMSTIKHQILRLIPKFFLKVFYK